MVAKKNAASSTPDTDSRFVRTWHDLADALQTTRRSLQEWRKDPRYSPDCPRPRADGRLEIGAFAVWMVRHGLKRADEKAHIDAAESDHDDDGEPGVLNPPKIGGILAQWKNAIAAKQFEKLSDELEKQRGNLLIAAALEIPVGTMLAAVQNKCAQYPAIVAPQIAPLRDVAECEDLLRREMDAALRELHLADYLEIAPREIVADLPFDPESERLLKLVTFDGQDHAALLDLIAHLVGEALRRVGKRSLIAAIEKRADLGEMRDDTTGQVTEIAAAKSSVERNASDSDSGAKNITKREKYYQARKSRSRKPAEPPADLAAIAGAKSPPRRTPPRRGKKRKPAN